MKQILIGFLLTFPVYASDPFPISQGIYESSRPDQNPVCPSGNLQIIGEKEDAVLIFGTNLVFPIPFGGSVTERPEAKGCEYKIETQLSKTSLSKTTTLTKCPEQEFNKSIFETLTMKNDELEYHLKSKDKDGDVDVKCYAKKTGGQ